MVSDMEVLNSTDEEKLKNIEVLSEDLFGKPAKEIKYLLVTNFIHQSLLDEELARTGLYQWVNTFKGDLRHPRDVADYNDYDIVQVNLSSQDLHMVKTIREQLRLDSKTLLVVNNDYTTEMWGQAFEYLDTFRRELEGADMYFGTEYFQVTALSEMTETSCYVIPHPADVKRLKHLKSLPKKNIISTVWRRYDNFSYIPALVVRNHGLTTQLIGYDKNLDKRVHLTTTLYDYTFPATNYFDYCDMMRESKIVYDPFTYHSYNRGIVDCAAMGVAVVGSNRTQSINVCYPFTAVDPFDVKTARELIKKLLTDKEFHDLVVNTALERVEFYNHLNSKERYLMALSEARKKEESPEEKLKPKVKEHSKGEDVISLLNKEMVRD